MKLNQEDQLIIDWSEKVAGLAVDALVDAGIVSKDSFSEATAIVAEEIGIRLAIGDRPELPKI